jgi:hypothetical protein
MTVELAPRVAEQGRDGDQNKPVQLDGTTLTVPVERHNYRPLVLQAAR